MADKNERLGKGLSALFGEKGVDVPPIGSKGSPLTELEISKINVNPYQPRKEFNSVKLKELSDSIKEKGVLQPITVKNSSKEGTFDLISGERRLRATQMAGLKTIPTFIYTREYKDERSEMLELALIENIQREDLNPMELSNSFLRLVDEIGLTQEEVAKKVSKDRSTVANFLRLQRLPDEIKDSLRKNDITEAHARMILRLEDRKEQLGLWNRIVSEKLSVRKLEDITRSSAKPKKKKSSAGQKWDPYLEKLEDRMRSFFGTRVKIVSKTNSSGHIIIEFYSNDDLDRIIEKCE